MEPIRRDDEPRIAALKTALTACHVYVARDGSDGEPVEPAVAWANLDRYPGQLSSNDDGTYTIELPTGVRYVLAVSDDPVTITRDGKPLVTVDGPNAAFRWLLRHQPQSVDWAIRYAGYAVNGADGKPLAGFGGQR